MGILASCDSSRVFEKNRDFENNSWRAADTTIFEIAVEDTIQRYNLIMNVRNTIDFETARLFVNYSLEQPGGAKMRKRLVEQNLFDRKTGEPFGKSGLGNIYDHQVMLEPAIQFPAKGNYTVRLNHMMRTDSLKEIMSIGIRLEKAIK